MKLPADAYTRPSSRPMMGLPEPTNPLQDHDIMVAVCGRICMHRKKINIPTVRAGQKLGLKEPTVIWLVSRTIIWDRRRLGAEHGTRLSRSLEDKPFSGTKRYRCLWAEH